MAVYWRLASALLAALLCSSSGMRLAQACSLPRGSCSPHICSSLSVRDYAPLLDPSAFNPANASSGGPWSAGPMRRLGHFFDIRNPLYDAGGHGPDAATAMAGQAPFLNLVEASKMGTMQKQKRSAYTLSKCCDRCRTAPECHAYAFAPDWVHRRDTRGRILSRAFTEGGTGTCFFLSLAASEQAQGACSVPSRGDRFDPSLPAHFLSGMCKPSIPLHAQEEPQMARPAQGTSPGNVQGTSGAGNTPRIPTAVPAGSSGRESEGGGNQGRSFCLVADTHLQLNALLQSGASSPRAGQRELRSWIREMGVLWRVPGPAGKTHTLHLIARRGPENGRLTAYLAQVTLDGAPLEVPSRKGGSIQKGDVKLKFQGMNRRGPFEQDCYSLEVSNILDLSLCLRPAHRLLQTPEDAQVHFNLAFNWVSVTERVHGVLGQAQRKTEGRESTAIKYSTLTRMLGQQGHGAVHDQEEALEGKVHDYETTSVTAADCKFSSIAAS